MVSARDGYQEDARSVSGQTIENGGLTWHRIALRSTGPRARARSYWEFFRRGLAASVGGAKPDVVFTSSPPPTQMLLAIIAALRWRVPLVLEIRDLWPFFLEGMGLVRSKPALAALRALEWLGYRSASAVVSVSPAFRPYLEACGIRPADLIDAPHGARPQDRNSLDAAGKAFRERHGLADRPIILFAGSLQEHYAVELWLHAVELWLAAAAALAQQRPEAVLVVAGGGRCRDRVEAAASAHRSIIYLGTVPRSDLDPAMGAADIGLVCLSPVAGFEFVLPGKLVDLLSIAIPVVTNVQGQTAKLVELSGGGWVATQDPNDLLDTLREALDAGSIERRRRGSLGRTFVTRHLAAQSQGDAIAGICEAAITKWPGSGPSRTRAPSYNGPVDAAALLRAGGAAMASASFESWLHRRRDLELQPHRYCRAADTPTNAKWAGRLFE